MGESFYTRREFVKEVGVEFAAFIYEAAAARNRWNDPAAAIANLSPAGLVLARELGDQTSLTRMSAAAEREYEPRFFGDDASRFGWWFQLKEKYPRGQRSALMMVADVGKGGDWIQVCQAPHLDKYAAPTVQDVDYPAVGITQAWNDVESGILHIGTDASSSDRRGLATSFRVTKLPNARRVTIRCDGQPFRRFQIEGPSSIRIDGTIDTHRYQVVTGYRGPFTTREEGQDDRPPVDRARREGFAQSIGAGSAAVTSSALAEATLADMPGCPCCTSES